MQSSTANISHIPNSNARKPQRRVAIPFRPWTKAQWLLRNHNISQRDIAEESGVDLSTVNRALSIRFFQRTGFGGVTRVRNACENLLLQTLKVKVNPHTLWDDYDIAMYGGEN